MIPLLFSDVCDLHDVSSLHMFFAAEYFMDRTDVQCLHRWQKVLNPDLVKGPWTKEVDHLPCFLYGCLL